jgi:hypothetical protein
MAEKPLEWHNTSEIQGRSYICGYCGSQVGPDRGFEASYRAPHASATWLNVYIHICSYCARPTFFDPDRVQWPGVPAGARVEALPPGVERLYEEARRCMSVSAYTAAVMSCRTLLMHIAHDRGSGEKANFYQYVDWLAEEHYVPRGGEAWVHAIRDKGNEANHEIPPVDEHAAMQVLSFTTLLLRNVYEAEAQLKATAPEHHQPTGTVI